MNDQNDATPMVMQDAMDTEPTSVQPPKPHFDLGAIKKRLTDTLNCTSHYVNHCEELECPVHQNARPPPTRPLYGGALSHFNQVTSVIEPPSLPHHNRQLYEVFDDIQEEEDCNMCACSGNSTQERAVQDLLCLV